MTTKPDQGDAKFEWHAGYLGVHDRRQGRSHLCLVLVEEAYEGELLLRGWRKSRTATIPLEDPTLPKEGIPCGLSYAGPSGE